MTHELMLGLGILLTTFGFDELVPGGRVTAKFVVGIVLIILSFLTHSIVL